MGVVGKTGIMFLTEVALGKEHHIDRDNSSLKAAPKGFDCVVAKGWTEPGTMEELLQLLCGCRTGSALRCLGTSYCITGDVLRT